MEPGNAAHPTSGAPPYRGGYGPPPQQGSWGPVTPRPEDEPGPVGPRRGRPGLIALIAVLVEAAVIAAAFNQAVTKHLVNYVAGHSRADFATNAVAAGLVYSWRVERTTGTRQQLLFTHHVVRGELVMVGSTLLLTALLVLALVRGPITWGRAFFGTWLAVIVATSLARIAAVASTGTPDAPYTDIGTQATFSGPNGYSLFAGAVLGLVVALIASLIAIATRRPPVRVTVPGTADGGGPGAAPESPPPYYGEAAGGSVPAPTGWARVPDEQTTAAFPMPPDDESLGYHGDPDRD